MEISEIAKINQAEHDKAQKRQDKAKFKQGKKAILSAQRRKKQIETLEIADKICQSIDLPTDGAIENNAGTFENEKMNADKVKSS